MWFQQIIEAFVSRQRSSSALAPVIWLNVVNLVPLGIVLEKGDAPMWLVLAFLALPAVAVYQLLFFTHSDPSRLQSEGHNQRLTALNRRVGFKSKGDALEVLLPYDAAMVANPAFLPPGERDGGDEA